tara:strand:- start:816 stop:1019 length:204 start_codon:yes stop_codon:yes gene_type:complete
MDSKKALEWFNKNKKKVNISSESAKKAKEVIESMDASPEQKKVLMNGLSMLGGFNIQLNKNSEEKKD